VNFQTFIFSGSSLRNLEKRWENSSNINPSLLSFSLISNFSRKIEKGNLKNALFSKNLGLTPLDLGLWDSNVNKKLIQKFDFYTMIFTQFQVIIIFIKYIKFIQGIFEKWELKDKSIVHSLSPYYWILSKISTSFSSLCRECWALFAICLLSNLSGRTFIW